ncbi:MAG TPA: outer membrane beta-barrel protein [Methylococcaceae bacterium]|nr:outer membrane beta-barrel protein [Methylococcaceae bacterium]
MKRLVQIAWLSGLSLAGSGMALAAGPYVEIEGGYGWAEDAQISDRQGYLAPNCLICQPGDLNHLESGGLVGAAVGYRFSDYFRTDARFTYREGHDLSDHDIIDVNYKASVESWAAMLSGYFDLPVSLGPVHPYIGGGIGWAWSTLSSIHQKWTPGAGFPAGTQTDPGGDNSSFAWQAMFGLNYAVTSSFAVDVGYRHFYGGRIGTDNGTSVISFAGAAPFSYRSGGVNGYLRTDEVVASLRYSF